MFFNEEFETELDYNYDGLNEAVEVDEFQVALYAEDMTGSVSDVYEMIMESDEEFHNLQVKMMKLEHVAIVSEDAMLLEEGKEGFVAKAKQMFKDLKEKMIAFFIKVKDWFLNLVQSDKKFLKKYGKDIQKATKRVPFAYTTDFSAITKFIGRNPIQQIEKIIRENAGESKNDVRNKAIRTLSNNQITDVKAIKTTVKEAITKEGQTISGAEAYKLVANFKGELAIIKHMEKASNEMFDQIINNFKDEKDAKYIAGEEKDKDHGKRVAVCKDFANVSQKLMGVLCEALKARKNAARNAVRAVVGGRGTEEEAKKEAKADLNRAALPAPEVKSESFLFDFNYGYENVLDRF